MHDTCDKPCSKPPVVQTSFIAYKPWLNKASTRMVGDGLLPDFEISARCYRSKIKRSGIPKSSIYYALPSDNMIKEFKKKRDMQLQAHKLEVLGQTSTKSLEMSTIIKYYDFI